MASLRLIISYDIINSKFAFGRFIWKKIKK